MSSDGLAAARLLRLGDDFDLDLGAYELRRGGLPIRLGRIPMELLLLLVEQRGLLVTRDQIIERVWGKDVFLDTDNSINAAIRKIRQILEDDSEQPRFVQTVIGRGYRFIAPIAEGDAPASTATVVELSVSEGLIGKKISHYRILQLLGGGGMGVVYMAEDLKLGRRVAIKFVPDEMAGDPKAFQKMQREARAASALDHPNICSVYELGEHSGEHFIVMQLLEGQTLREWILAAKNLSALERMDQLLKLAIQIADGLEAAHQNYTIHRDIKPANIFVTNQGQAKILDFGVAQLSAGIEEAAVPQSHVETRVTVVEDIEQVSSDTPVGTPSYLSPEQIRHGSLDARSDLFSFGLVLYEMATGYRAFSGKNTAVIHEALLDLPVTPAQELNPSLSPELERIIAKCLEKEPSARYQSAAELRKDLAVLQSPMEAAEPRPSRWMFWAIACPALVVVLVAALYFGAIRSRTSRMAVTGDPIVAVKARPSVAVVGFKNLSGKDDQAWISTALSEMLAADLASGQQLRLIAGENVARMKVDLALPAADSYSAETLKKIRWRLNSDMVVLGSYLAVGASSGGKIRVNLQLQDAKGGETIAVVSEDGNEADLAELVSRSGDQVRQILRIGSLSAQDADQVRAALPENAEAARYYAEGLTKLRTFDALSARDLFLKAIAADQNHSLSHAALSRCWSDLGYDSKAQEEAKKAMILSSKLSREGQLAVEAQYRWSAHEWQAAMEIYRMLWGFFPDNLDYGLDLARVESSAGMGKEALATVSSMSQRPQPEGDDPRIDLAEAIVVDKLGDLRREEKAAARAAEKAQRQEARVLAANALLTRGSVLGDLGEPAKGVASLREAQAIFSTVGDRQGLGRVLLNQGSLARRQSNLVEAQKLTEESLETFRKMGSEQGMLQAWNNLGNVLWDRGDMPRALQAHQESLKLAREVGDKFHESSSLGNIGGLQTLQGKLGEARQTYDEALRLARGLGDKEGAGTVLGNLADLLTRQGDLPAAKKFAEEALAADRQVGNKSFEAYALYQLAAVLISQGDVTAGRSKLQETIHLRHELGQQTTEAETQLAMAQLELDTGDAKAAELLAREIAPAFHDGSMKDDEALDYSLLAMALVEQGRSAEAQQAAAKCNQLLPQTMDFATRLQVDVASAYLLAMDSGANSEKPDPGKVEGATLSLEAARVRANQFRYVGVELEARLRQAEFEISSGKESAGKVHLQKLQTDAQDKGFVLIARRASAAMRTESSRR